MLLVLKRFSDVNLREIKTLYCQTMTGMAEETFCGFSESEKNMRAEDQFTEDLRNFFRIPDGKLFALQVDGRYASALRAEPYLDGELFSFLETRPEMRGRGYAGMLVSAAVEQLEKQGIRRIYSHIHKKNFASIAVHRSCGFHVSADCARLLDGTVSQLYYTFQYNSTAE